MAIPSTVLVAAVKLAERHDRLASAEWVMRWFGVMTFGIERIGFNETNARCDYVNRGDTYDDTVYYDDASGSYCIGSWGDWLESVESAYAESSGEYHCPNCGDWSEDTDECDSCGYSF